jgi:hypothetical protein
VSEKENKGGNFVAIDSIIRNQLDAQQDATPKGKNLNTVFTSAHTQMT